MTFDPNRVSVEEIAAAISRIGFSAQIEKA
jgi:hypothetical protein